VLLINKQRKQIEKYETSFSRLRTQGPQTPGKLHEMQNARNEAENCNLRAPMLFPSKVGT
jgi:hypothetical protein